MRHVIRDIHCSVCSCIYNEGEGKCAAGQIDVGPSQATNCTETLCSTFECRQNPSDRS